MSSVRSVDSFMNIKLLSTTENACNRYIVVMFESFDFI